MGVIHAVSTPLFGLPSHATHDFVTRLMNSALQERHADSTWRYDSQLVVDGGFLEVAFASRPKRRTTWPRDYWFKSLHAQQDPARTRMAVHTDLARLARTFAADINDIHSFVRFPPVRTAIRTLLIELESPEAQDGQQHDEGDIVDRVNEAITGTSPCGRRVLLAQTTQAAIKGFADKALVLCLMKLYVHFENWNYWEFGHGEQRSVVLILVSIVGLFCDAWVNAPEIDLAWGRLSKTPSSPFPYSDVIDRSKAVPDTRLTPEVWLEWSLMYDPWIRTTDSIQILSARDIERSTLASAPPIFIADVSEPEADKEGRVTVKYHSKPDEERWSFKTIIDSRWAGKTSRTGLQYLVEWEYAEPSWQPARDLQGCEPWVLEFHRANPGKAGPVPKLRRLL